MDLANRPTFAIHERQRKFSKILLFVGMSILFSGLINLVIPSRIFYCVLFTIAILVGHRQGAGNANTNYLLVPILFLFSAGLFINFIVESSPVTKEVLTRLIILFPLSVILGSVITRSKEFGSFILGYSQPVFLIALFAPYELLVGHLIERNPDYDISDRLGITRVSFFVEHPLILASHLALLASLLILNIVPRSPVFKLLVFVASISTISLGPVLIIFSLLVFFRNSSIKTMGKYLVIFTISILLSLMYLALRGVSTNILTASTFGISLNYRAIIYGNLIPNTLRDNPLGYGLQGLQEGLFRVNLTNYSVDLARSIDSQPALLIIQGGWILLIPYLILCLVLLVRVWRSEYRAYPALISILLGLFVPLHAFTSTCVIQGILFGVAFSRKAQVNR
jgi:hypothetical protein